jgi:asparagine synthase (glutamine-hydrolysing)
MCGILGAVNQSFDDSVLDLLQSRGPDGSGLSSATIGSHRLTFGHRRLSILDLSPAGHQPMRTPCGQTMLTFNGEIYNHLELRKNLPGVAFRGHSDTETVLHAIAIEGILAVRDFNGIFAFGLLDQVRSKLYLARDPFGVKPLYYFLHDNTLVFSSEIKPILALVQDAPDPAHLAELLRLRYLPAPDTLFRKIKKVRPGHIVEIDLARAELVGTEYPYFSAPAAADHISFDDAVDRYGELFQGAVRRQLLSDVEVGVLLSGGVDSALVAAHACRDRSYRMKAFTIGFSMPDGADETASARETAGLLGMDYFEARIGFNDFLDKIRECTAVVEEPLATTSLIPMFTLAKLASDSVKVVLSGQGADETLGGYGRYRGEQIRALWPGAPFDLVHALAKGCGLRHEQMLRGLRSFGKAGDIERFISAYTVFEQEDIVALIGEEDALSSERLRYCYDLLGCDGLKTGAERMMRLDLRTNLADDLLLYTDKITMHHSLECRVPMLDLELVRFVESLPASYRVGLLRGKIIHKKYAAKVLPEKIVNRPKQGFASPTNLWFKNGNVLRDIFQDSSSGFTSYFDLNVVNRIISEHEKGFNRERQLFLLLSISAWMAEFAH